MASDVHRVSEPGITSPLTALRRFARRSELGVHGFELSLALTRRVFDVSQGAESEAIVVQEVLPNCITMYLHMYMYSVYVPIYVYIYLDLQLLSLYPATPPQ
jgi:hypothetical protein